MAADGTTAKRLAMATVTNFRPAVLTTPLRGSHDSCRNHLGIGKDDKRLS
jgi:hypothetical protein